MAGVVRKPRRKHLNSYLYEPLVALAFPISNENSLFRFVYGYGKQITKTIIQKRNDVLYETINLEFTIPLFILSQNKLSSICFCLIFTILSRLFELQIFSLD